MALCRDGDDQLKGELNEWRLRAVTAETALKNEKRSVEALKAELRQQRADITNLATVAMKRSPSERVAAEDACSDGPNAVESNESGDEAENGLSDWLLSPGDGVPPACLPPSSGPQLPLERLQKALMRDQSLHGSVHDSSLEAFDANIEGLQASLDRALSCL